jgi:capsular polysaccharide biosynthesis protein
VKRLLLWAVAASLLAAVVVTVASLWQTPTYEATARVLVGLKPHHEPEEQLTNLGGSGEMIQTLPPPGSDQLDQLTQTMVHAIDTRPVAEETIRRLGLPMSPDQLLNNLTVEQIEDTQFIRLGYTDTDPKRAEQIVNMVGQVSSERISASSASGNIVATVFEKAGIPLAPVSPKPWRNGLLTLVIGLALCAGTALARTAVGTRVAGTLGERPSRQGVGQAGVLGRRHSAPSILERVKEKELLRALGHRGKLTAVEAALETSLTVEEADRILSELAHNGHLKVTVEHGKLLYSFWEHDAP